MSTISQQSKKRKFEATVSSEYNRQKKRKVNAQRDLWVKADPDSLVLRFVQGAPGKLPIAATVAVTAVPDPVMTAVPAPKACKISDGSESTKEKVCDWASLSHEQRKKLVRDNTRRNKENTSSGYEVLPPVAKLNVPVNKNPKVVKKFRFAEGERIECSRYFFQDEEARCASRQAIDLDDFDWREDSNYLMNEDYYLGLTDKKRERVVVDDLEGVLSSEEKQILDDMDLDFFAFEPTPIPASDPVLAAPSTSPAVDNADLPSARPSTTDGAPDNWWNPCDVDAANL